MNPILVTGATGTVGSHVVRELRERGVAARAFVRDPQRAAALLGDDVPLAVGDFTDPASIRAALDGVQRVFLCCGNHPGQVADETNVIDAAAAAGVRRLVKISAPGSQLDAPVEFARIHARIEAHLAGSGVPAVVLRPGFYLTNLLAGADTIRSMGRFFLPAGDAKVAMTDPRDVAAVAAVALTEDGHEGRAYAVTGPALVTCTEVAEHLGTALRRPVEFVDVPDDAARAGMTQAGVPEWLAEQIVLLWGELRRGGGGTTTDVVRVLTGREPRGVAEFVRDHAAAFGP